MAKNKITNKSFNSGLSELGNVLLPIFRRAYSQMIAKDLVGVQPMKSPSGMVFASKPVFDRDAHKRTEAYKKKLKIWKNLK